MASKQLHLVYQPAVAGSRELAEKCAPLGSKHGLEPVLVASGGLDGSPVSPPGSFALTFGGDGTILRAARWATAGADVRVIGVQMGRLGFLAELQPGEVIERLGSYLAGDYWLDRRAMLGARVIKVAGAAVASAWVTPFLALNDIVVGRGAIIRTVSVEILVDGNMLHEFRCDGVIVATATGSTAYSFACGGPVLAPAARELVITPISPHLSNLKSFVVPADSPIQLQVSSTDDAMLTVDGQVDQPLGQVGAVEAQIASATTLFARQGTEAELYRRILAKLD